MRRNWWSLFLVGAALLIAVPDDAFAQRRSGGSRSSRSSSRSKSKPAARKKASNPARGKAGGKASGKKGQYGSSKKKASNKASKKKVTKADQAAYDKAKLSGKTATSRKGAMKKFSSDPANAKKYRTDFKEKPANRPGHVPQSYSYKGSNVTINHYDGHGYGHWSGGGMGMGLFIGYNAMLYNTSYMDRQMAMQGWHIGQRPVIVAGTNWGLIIVVLAVIGGIAFVMTRKRGMDGGM